MESSLETKKLFITQKVHSSSLFAWACGCLKCDRHCFLIIVIASRVCADKFSLSDVNEGSHVRCGLLKALSCSFRIAFDSWLSLNILITIIRLACEKFASFNDVRLTLNPQFTTVTHTQLTLTSTVTWLS